MQNEMGPVVLDALSVVFVGYGLREVVLDYKSAALRDWSEKAVQGAAGVGVAVVFAGMTLQILN